MTKRTEFSFFHFVSIILHLVLWWQCIHIHCHEESITTLKVGVGVSLGQSLRLGQPLCCCQVTYFRCVCYSEVSLYMNKLVFSGYIPLYISNSWSKTLRIMDRLRPLHSIIIWVVLITEVVLQNHTAQIRTEGVWFATKILLSCHG